MSIATNPPMESADKSCWLQTYSGLVFRPLNPDPATIRLRDIAAALSKQCRFAGHCLRFYSVAEHCVQVARAAPDELKLTALLHDASEAYLVDIPRPLKPWLTGYAAMEDRLMRVIAERFGIIWPPPAIIKNIDCRILSDERMQNMAMSDIEPLLWGNVEPPLFINLAFWSPDEAYREFVTAFHMYGGI
jgi:hypothetical protein